MLLRSSSTPVLQSLLPQSSPEPECFLQITPKSRSCSIPSPFSFGHDQIKKMSRNLSESDLIIRGTSSTKCSCMHAAARFLVPVEDVEEDEEDEEEMGCKVGDGNSIRAAEVVVGGGGGDWSGVGAGGWGGGDGDDDGGYGWCWDANNGNSRMDLYYEKMIETNPGNSMLLSNYARFLKEFRGDLVKAEEYCGRAILVNPNDGNVLSLYADVIWQMYEDAKRAHIYFDRAVKAAPDNRDGKEDGGIGEGEGDIADRGGLGGTTWCQSRVCEKSLPTSSARRGMAAARAREGGMREAARVGFQLCYGFICSISLGC